MRDLTLSFLLFSGLCRIFEVQAFSVSNLPVTRPSLAFSPSPLFQSRLDSHIEGKDQKSLFTRNARGVARKRVSSKTLQARGLRWINKVRRSVVLVAASLLVWFGAASINTPPSHASTTSSVTSMESRNILSASLDQIVDRYVKSHMFDDDVYEPVESVYREAMGDKVKGTHPKALSEITSSILGQDGIKADTTSSSNGIGDWLMNAVGFLQRKGLSESTAIIVLTGTFVVAGPVVFLLGAMMVGSQSKRQIQSVMKKRYGDTYT